MQQYHPLLGLHRVSSKKCKPGLRVQIVRTYPPCYRPPTASPGPVSGTTPRQPAKMRLATLAAQVRLPQSRRGIRELPQPARPPPGAACFDLIKACAQLQLAGRALVPAWHRWG